MIAAIPAEDRPTIIVQPIPAKLAPHVHRGHAEGTHTRQAEHRKRCLSCGARTNAAGDLPCGH